MKILLALDSSARASEEAVRIAKERGASLTALFVLDSSWSDYIGHDWLSGSNARAGFLDYVEENEQVLAGKAIEAFGKTAGSLPVKVKMTAGRVADSILAELKNGYDLLVMAASFQRGLEALRNTSTVIARDAPCSVYLVREK